MPSLDPRRSQLVRGATPLLVLALLRDRELYGYQIAQEIRERSGGAFAPSEGSLYPALHRLEADGALTAEWRAGDRGPRRRYYRITEKGGAALTAHEREWLQFSSAVRGVAFGRATGG
jgi:PadR family transcriptional regulator PadR